MGERDEEKEMLRQILDGQQKQGDRLKAHGETLSEYGAALDDLSSTVSDLEGTTNASFTRIKTEFGHLKERAQEDREAAERRAKEQRERADNKEAELEGKVGKAHQNNQGTAGEVSELRGEFRNHIEDNHATVALQTKSDLNTHVANNDRHVGEAPGLGGTAKTAGIAGASTGGLFVIYKLAEMFLAGGS